MISFQVQRTDIDSSGILRAVGDPCLIISNTISVLKLISERVMQNSDCKRIMNHNLHSLLSEKGTDESILLCVLDVVKRWIEGDPNPVLGNAHHILTTKEIVTYLQKLSQVDRTIFSPTVLEEWDSKYLNMLYVVCMDSCR